MKVKNENKECHSYDDIINLPNPTSKVHPRMSLQDRAAQFSPFAALTGHDKAIKETSRLTENRMELDEDAKARLNEKLQIIKKNIDADITATITYFVPDERKNGGEYISCCEKIKKIDEYKSLIIMMDGTSISIPQIYEIESDLFGGWELFD